MSEWRPEGDVPAWLTDLLRARGTFAAADRLFSELEALHGTAKTCPNCGATFFQQEGRAEKGQNRTTGVIYCSKRCANTAGQRRRRQARS